VFVDGIVDEAPAVVGAVGQYSSAVPCFLVRPGVWVVGCGKSGGACTGGGLAHCWGSEASRCPQDLLLVSCAAFGWWGMWGWVVWVCGGLVPPSRGVLLVGAAGGWWVCCLVS
jgi:hypothetical protein